MQHRLYSQLELPELDDSSRQHDGQPGDDGRQTQGGWEVPLPGYTTRGGPTSQGQSLTYSKARLNIEFIYKTESLCCLQILGLGMTLVFPAPWHILPRIRNEF